MAPPLGGVGDQQGVEGSGNGAGQAVQAGAHDPLGPEMLQGLSEQHRGGVVLDGPGDQPVAEGFPIAAPTGPPTGVGDDHLDVLTPGTLRGLGAVADEGNGRHPDLLGQAGGDLGWGGAGIGGHEAEEAEGAALHRETETDRGAGAERSQPAQILDRQGEVGGQVALGDLGWPRVELGQLGVIKGAARKGGPYRNPSVGQPPVISAMVPPHQVRADRK